MYVPKRELYESEFINLTDEDTHEIEMTCIGEGEKEYNGKKKQIQKWVVLREWIRGVEKRYDPPKRFETGSVDFVDLAERATKENHPTVCVLVTYDQRRKNWDIRALPPKNDSPHLPVL